MPAEQQLSKLETPGGGVGFGWSSHELCRACTRLTLVSSAVASSARKAPPATTAAIGSGLVPSPSASSGETRIPPPNMQAPKTAEAAPAAGARWTPSTVAFAETSPRVATTTKSGSRTATVPSAPATDADQVPAGLVHRVLAVEPLVAVVGHDHPFTGRTSAVDPAELARFGAFVEMRAASGVRRQVDAAFSRARVTRTVVFELSTSDDVVRFVGLGFGAAVVPRSAVGSRPDVTTLPLRDDLARHPVSLLHRAPEPSAPSTRALLELIGR